MMSFSRENMTKLMKSVVFVALAAMSWMSLAQENSGPASELVAMETDRVNINHADAETIARILDGVGMSRAEAIVAYREEFGNFASLEELRMVKGVGEVTLRNNESKISFD